MRIIVAAHYASNQLGGEGLLPLHVVRELRALGHDVWLVTHVSCQPELSATVEFAERTIFVRSLPGLNFLHPFAERLPPAPRALIWAVTQIERQWAMLPEVRRLVVDLGIDLVHQPISVSPSIPSPFHKLGVPLVLGPLNGGMDLPPSFRDRDSRLARVRKRTRPALAFVLHSIFRGHRTAQAIFVANDRTRELLQKRDRHKAIRMSDIGVDLNAFIESPRSRRPGRLRLIYVGRLVSWKGVDLLISACAELRSSRTQEVDFELQIVGDGPSREALSQQVKEAGLGDRVTFSGWLSRDEVKVALVDSDVLVLPSLEEAGGAVALEAMAAGLVPITANWGGPSYLLDDSCGIRVAPSTVAGYTSGLASAITRLADDPVGRTHMSEHGVARVRAMYTWPAIVKEMTIVYERLLDSRG